MSHKEWQRLCKLLVQAIEHVAIKEGLESENCETLVSALDVGHEFRRATV